MRTLLSYPEAEVLWQADVPANSSYDEAREAPFNKAINVFGEGLPE